jgi:DNA-binding NarL/FixJ family response regulator
MSAVRRVRVFVVSTNQFTLWGMRSMLEACAEDFVWVGSQGPAGLLAEIDRRNPQVVVCHMPLLGALLDLPQALKKRGIGILMVQEQVDAQDAEALVKLGVTGVIHGGEATATFLSAIKQVATLKLWLSSQLVDQMLERAFSLDQGGGDMASIALLTARERQLIRVLVRNPEAKAFALGSMLNLNEATVRNRLSRIYRKLKVHGKTALVLFANKHRLY